MVILIDSSNLAEVREAFELPFVCGCTTNTREVAYHGGHDIAKYLREMRGVVRGKLHVQVTSEKSGAIIAEGRAIAAFASDMRVKIPVTLEGLKAIEALSAEGVECCATACNTVAMAVLSAKMGAASIISYYGALEGLECRNSDLLAATKRAFAAYGFKTEIMYYAATALQAREGMELGLNGCLMTLEGLKSLYSDSFSSSAVDFMLVQWEKSYGDLTWDAVLRQ